MCTPRTQLLYDESNLKSGVLPDPLCNSFGGDRPLTSGLPINFLFVCTSIFRLSLLSLLTPLEERGLSSLRTRLEKLEGERVLLRDLAALHWLGPVEMDTESCGVGV